MTSLKEIQLIVYSFRTFYWKTEPLLKRLITRDERSIIYNEIVNKVWCKGSRNSQTIAELGLTLN